MKTFTQDEAVEVIRDTEHARPWEAATYLSVITGWKGWHRVRLATGERLDVPARRIRAKKKER